MGAVNASDPQPVVSDAQCATATYVQPAVPGASGEGSCRTLLTIPPATKSGIYRITNTAASASAGSVSGYVDIEVTALARSGLRVVESSVPWTGYVNRQMAMNVPFTVNSGIEVSNVKYEWTAASTNPSSVVIAGARNSTATITPTVAGQYSFNIKVSADINGFTETANGTFVASIFPTTTTDEVDAGLAQIVATNTVVTLTGRIANRDNSLAYTTTWSQVNPVLGGGPTSVQINSANTTTASFIAPSMPGTYVFELRVAKTAADGSQTVTTAQTSVLVQSAAAAAFTVSAGDAQNVSIGVPATLKGSVGAQGNSTGVTYQYQWTQVTGVPAQVTLSGANSPTASFIPTVSGTYTFALRVTANTKDGATSITGITQVVANQSGSGPVTTDDSFAVSAGNAQTASVNTPVVLSGDVTPKGAYVAANFSYSWTQVGTTPAMAMISNANTKTASFIPTATGVYTFDLTVVGKTPSATSTVTTRTQVVVSSSGSSGTGLTKFAMTASAGPAQAVAPGAIVQLSGFQMSQGDTAGITYTYQWSQVGATPSVVSLSNANTIFASFIANESGVYSFRLSVTAEKADGTMTVSTADTQVLVGGAGNTFSVSAGDAQKVSTNTPVTMAGVVTTQGNFAGATFNYAWSQVGSSPSAVLISNSNSLTGSFVPTVAGTYRFMLTVTTVQGGITTVRSSQTQILVQ